MSNNPFGFLIILLSVLWISVYCSIPDTKPNNNIKVNQQIPIGYNFAKVGKDSVLVVKGTYVRQVGDRVYIKIN